MDHVRYEIPVRLVKPKPVPFEFETMAYLNAPFFICRLNLRPISIGVFSLLELLDSPLNNLESATRLDLLEILYINHHREKCLQDVLIAQTLGSRNYKPWIKKLKRFGLRYMLRTNLMKLEVPALLNLCFLGFEMLPKSGGGGKFIFGSENLAGVINTCAQSMNISANNVLWNTSCTAVGHHIAAAARCSGVKGVSRPPDKQHMEELKQTMIECDEKGKLYPWQEQAESVLILKHYKLMPQQQANKDTVKQYETLMTTLQEQEKANNGKA
jgi:hypothetical protein